MNTEAEQIRRAYRLDGQALADIYDAHSDEIYRYAMRLLGDVDTAEECVSETFTRFLIALKKKEKAPENLRAYLFRIAHNWITDFYRRSAPIAQPIDAEISLASDDNPAKKAFENLQLAQTRAALQQLTPDQRAVIMLKFFEGWDNAEIAASLSKPIGAVKSLQHRGLTALKRILLDDDYE